METADRVLSIMQWFNLDYPFDDSIQFQFRVCDSMKPLRSCALQRVSKFHPSSVEAVAEDPLSQRRNLLRLLPIGFRQVMTAEASLMRM